MGKCWAFSQHLIRPLARAICRISPFAYRENSVFAVPSDELRRGQSHHPYAPAVRAKFARTLRGFAPQGKPRITRLRPTGGLSLYRASSQKWAVAQLALWLKLWGVAVGGSNNAWHECRTARCPQGGRKVSGGLGFGFWGVEFGVGDIASVYIDGTGFFFGCVRFLFVRVAPIHASVAVFSFHTQRNLLLV